MKACARVIILFLLFTFVNIAFPLLRVSRAQVYEHDLALGHPKIIQVVKDPNVIVAYKPAAISVEIFSSFDSPVSVPIELKYNFGNSTYLELGPYGKGVPIMPGYNTVYLPGGPVSSSNDGPWIDGPPYLIWETDGTDSEIEVVVDPDHIIELDNPKNNSAVIEKEIINPMLFKVLYTPVLFGNHYDFSVSDEAVNRQKNFMLNTYPLASLVFTKRSTVHFDTVDDYNESTAYDDFVFDISTNAVLFGYDRAAIVINTPSFSYCGVAIKMLSAPVDRVPVILDRFCVETQSKESLTAHEIGHTFYLWHPHCEWFNDLRVFYDIKYSVIDRDFGIQRNTFMSYESSPHWIDRYRYQDYPKTWFPTPEAYKDDYSVTGSYQWNLLDQFQSQKPTKVFFIKAKLFKSGAFEMRPWYLISNIPDLEPGPLNKDPDMSLNSLVGQNGDTRRNLNIVFLNRSQQQIAIFPFMVAFTMIIEPDFEGEKKAVETDAVPFYFKVPFIDGVKYIVITDEYNNVLGKRTISDNAPEVTVLNTDGGKCLNPGEPVTICWSGEDQDDDSLIYSMALSSDGGTEWVPIVSEIEDTCYHLDTADLDNGTDYIAKIIATDGINTGEDVSDTAFCIGRPEAPTFAEEIIFTGSPAKSMVNLSWSAISEENVMGYNILRRQGKKNDYARINKNIIPAKGSIQTTVSYEYADEDVKSGWLYDYLLIEVETDGKTKHHGPVSIVPRWFYGALNK